MPICVDQSCDADIFFIQVLFAAWSYGLVGVFASTFDEDGDGVEETQIATSTYTPKAFRSVSAIPTQAPTRTPTTVPTKAPTTSSPVTSGTESKRTGLVFILVGCVALFNFG